MLSICKSREVNYVVTYCEFNKIPYVDITLWDSNLDFGRYNIPDELICKQNHILVIDLDVFRQLVEYDFSYNQLIKYLENNYLLTTHDGEGYFILRDINRDRVRELNQLAPKNSILLITDCRTLGDFWIHQLDHFIIEHLPTFTSALSETRMFRFSASNDTKDNVQNDFMLTMIRKVARPHREVLWQQLSARPTLMSQGLALYHQYNPQQNSNPYETMAGEKPGPNMWIDAFPSMDLYRNAWVEIVPETLHNDAHYFTEKTLKPILTRTPFLVVSTPGYLEYIRSLGFLTFDGLIDESYDLQPDIADRVRLMLDQLEIIVKNGSSNFYHASMHILEHNRCRLAEIIGSSNYDKDLLLNRCFKHFNR